MPFVYRLQKILDFRIRKKEEQLLAVQKAQRALFEAEQNIIKNNREIEMTKQSQRRADPRLLEAFDKYLHHLWDKAKELEAVRQEKEQLLQIETHKLVELEKAVKVLEKHKEKNKEAYLEEEKQAELKSFSEIAVQRYFQHTRQQNEEDEEDLLKQIELMEGENLNEY